MLATCGYGTRQRQIVSDTFVKAGRPVPLCTALAVHSTELGAVLCAN